MKLRVWALAGLLVPFLGASLASARVRLVVDGEPWARVVLPAEPTGLEREAAQDLVWHVERSSGARLAVYTEDELPSVVATDGFSRIYIGATAAARQVHPTGPGADVPARGWQPAELPPDGYVLRSVGRDLFVVGRDSGTRHGVSDLLERTMGARWLWPGELGVYVRRSATIEIPSLRVFNAPKLEARHIRWGRLANVWQGRAAYDPLDARIGFSPDVLDRFAEANQVYRDRHRFGGTHPKPRTGHEFEGWWEAYGEDHPEWFMLNEEGERGPLSGASKRRVALCVSNEALQDYIVERWRENPRWGERVLTLGEVDARVFCQCEDCLAWDAPQPAPPPAFAAGIYDPWVSDRYARFWRTIYEKASSHDPDVLVTTFLYWNYAPAPVIETNLNRHIYGEFVPWGSMPTYYPMPEESDAWLREQWLGWARTGIRLAYRPNHPPDGYQMPVVDTWQSGRFLQFAYRHGMERTDFCSLGGQWSIQGLKLYVMHRLISDPELDIGAVRREYFEAFGPAAGQVERYWDYWEDYSREHIIQYPEPGHSNNRFHRYVRTAYLDFPPDAFVSAEELLAEALEVAAAADLPEYAERVHFLQVGLEHARLAAALSAVWKGEPTGLPQLEPDRIGRAQQALEALVAFRRQHEALFFADLYSFASRQERMNLLGIDDVPLDLEGQAAGSGERATALRALGAREWGPELAAALEEGLQDPHLLVRHTAREMLAERHPGTGEESALLLSAFAEALRSEDEAERWTAARLLQSLAEPPAALARLVEPLSDDPSARVRAAAGQIDIPAVVNRVLGEREDMDDALHLFNVFPLAPGGWVFRVDPENRGEAEVWFAGPVDDWEPIRIEQSWQQAGYTHSGPAWYRQHMELPAAPVHQAVMLHLHDSAGPATVWLNGVQVGGHDPDVTPDGGPLLVDITDQIEWEGENLFAVRVAGAGERSGLVGPVHIEIYGTARIW